MVLILATFLWATYREVERTLAGAGHKRADAAAEQIADMLSGSVQPVMEQTVRMADDPAVRAYMQNPTTQTREAASKVLVPSTAQALRRIELWDADGSLILEIATSPADSVKGLKSYPRVERPSRAGVSELQAAGEWSFFQMAVAIRDSSGGHLGYLRRYGRVTTTPGGRVRRLLGDEAIVKVGTINGAVWTDLLTVVDPPPTHDARRPPGEARAADGQRWLADTAAIRATPWVTWVGFPRALILAPARAFIQRMLIVALLFVAGGIVLVSILSTGLTRPLRALASAAEVIAAGDYTRRVSTGRRDEIGQLSNAFNAMTDRIQEMYGALKQSHEHTHFSLAAARIGVWESQLDTGRMTCSDSMRLVHGLNDTDALPQTPDAFLELVYPDDRESVRTMLEGRAPQNEVFDLEYRALAPDGSVYWLEGKGRVEMDGNARPLSVLGVSEDVTERRRLESQLRQAQKMEAVGQLAGGVAHDFNNLLTAIVGHGNLMLDELPEQDDRRANVIEILRAGESAAGLTRQLLAFSRRQVLQPKVIAINTVVAHTEKMLRRLIGEHIALVTDLAPDLHTAKVDPGQLEQVLVNLAVNARDAMPDGGTLAIATANTNFSEVYVREHAAVPPGRYVMLSVSDTGTGMDADTQARLFEPFFTTKPPGKGTGLGLATVFGIVKQSGGHINVFSKLRRGSRFVIYLPATDEKASTIPKTAAAAKVVGGQETILIVEDDASVRAIARTILERIGYRVTVAASGEEALAMAEANQARPDLVISDVIMPGMTGPELSRQLATRYPGVKVLFTSGYSGEEIVRHGVQESGTMFIEKPYTPAALASKVRDALGHRSGAAEVP